MSSMAEEIMARHPVGSASSAGSAGEWETPLPLTISTILPAFPADIFPSWLARQVEGVARFTQTPEDLAGGVALGILSSAAGGRAVVEIRGGWREPVNLYLVAAMDPGERKSPVFSAMTAPLLDAEERLTLTAGPQVIEAAARRAIADAAADQLVREAGRADRSVREDKTAEAIAERAFAESITVPETPRLTADDVTPEQAVSLMASQGGRLALLSAEGGIFSIIAGRYSQGAPNLDWFLKAWSGDTIKVDRKGRPPEFIRSPAMTMCLCVQPELLRQVHQVPGFRGRGLLARLLYSSPRSRMGSRLVGQPGVPEEVSSLYHSTVARLTVTLAGWEDPAVLMLTPDAAALHLAAEADLEPRLDPARGDLWHIKDWAAKLIGSTARLAGLLHLARHPDDGWRRPVDAATMRDALSLGTYFTSHALAAFGDMGADPELEDARVLLNWITRTQSKEFSRRDIYNGVRGTRFPKAADVDAPLITLAEHGYIRVSPSLAVAGTPGRPPSPRFEAHPSLFG